MPTTTNYIWDEDNLLAEADGTNAINAVYTYEPQEHGNLVSTQIGGITAYHHFDSVGSTRQLTDGVGHITDSMIYDAWGTVIARTGTTNVTFVWLGEIGYYYDLETGIFWIAVRPYSPALGRWTPPDTLTAQIYICTSETIRLIGLILVVRVLFAAAGFAIASR